MESVTLSPFKGFQNGIGSLKERYSEDTADVFFVNKETKERLPAHRQVLSVASAVFFKMFNGDWKEKEEKEIPAPKEYKWESFKAAITLLYGDEVEVEGSSIPDIYAVAHCYDLAEVLPIIAHAISQWGCNRLDTVLKLCALAAEEKELMQAVVKFIAVNLEKIKKTPLKLGSLPYDAMLMLVQSKNISAPEAVLLGLLNEWTEGQPEVSLKKLQELYSHIRYGIVPYESLLCCVTHRNLRAVFQMHQQLSIDNVKENLIQLTPRPLQKDAFQVFPLAPDVAVTRQEGKWEFMNCRASPSVGVFYAGKQECSFEVDVRGEGESYPSLDCKLTSIYDVEKPKVTHGPAKSGTKSVAAEKTVCSIGYCRHLFVSLTPRGAHVIAESSESKEKSISKKHHLAFSRRFPWLFEFGLSTVIVTSSRCVSSFACTVRHPI